MSDIVTQEMLEQLFHDYAKKVFRFYHRRDITHIERMKEVKIFSLTNQTIIRPQRTTKRKDYTRMHKITLNWIEKNIAENARQDNVIVHELEKVREYFLTAYGMEKWAKEREDEKEWEKYITNKADTTLQEHYRQKFAGLSNETARRAAQKWTEHEEAFLNMAAMIDEEDSDISTDMYHDILQMERALAI